METKTCANCGKPIKGLAYPDGDKFYDHNCYQPIRQQRLKEAFEAKFPDSASREIATLQFLQDIYLSNKATEKHLDSIKTILIVVLSLAGIAILLQSCAALSLI